MEQYRGRSPPLKPRSVPQLTLGEQFESFVYRFADMAQIRIVESFDTSFTLKPEAKADLFTLLRSEGFLAQLAEQLQCGSLEFTELLFQPVPYSANTPKGMPSEFEPYFESADHAIVNVPPNFMFKAKVFSPSRLCAVYRLVKV
jgi:hypothetical protein